MINSLCDLMLLITMTQGISIRLPSDTSHTQPSELVFTAHPHNTYYKALYLLALAVWLTIFNAPYA